ncbi:MAG: nucleotidyltransferase family protein [Chloroflexota bacterium]|nr:nucleotidyltransferase family protein [Chloroflexota bacterium]
MWKRFQSLIPVLLSVIGGLVALGIVVIIWYPHDGLYFLYARPFYPTYSVQQLWENPLPLPAVIAEVPREYNLADVPIREPFCVYVNTHLLWEPVSADVHQAVQRSVSMTIGGTTVDGSEVRVGALTIQVSRYDEQRRLIGSHPGTISICHQDLELADGMNIRRYSQLCVERRDVAQSSVGIPCGVVMSWLAGRMNICRCYNCHETGRAPLMTDAIRQPLLLADLRKRRNEILALAERYGAYNVRVFGSVVRNEATPDSDVDLLVSYRPGTSLLDVVAFWQDIQELLNCRVDVVDDRAIKPRLRDSILHDAQPL